MVWIRAWNSASALIRTSSQYPMASKQFATEHQRGEVHVVERSLRNPRSDDLELLTDANPVAHYGHGLRVGSQAAI